MQKNMTWFTYRTDCRFVALLSCVLREGRLTNTTFLHYGQNSDCLVHCWNSTNSIGSSLPPSLSSSFSVVRNPKSANSPLSCLWSILSFYRLDVCYTFFILLRKHNFLQRSNSEDLADNSLNHMLSTRHVNSETKMRWIGIEPVLPSF